jgi:NADH dehydrogenase FAD-containing subunit
MKITVIGGGIGGLEFIRCLKGLDVTLIEPRDRMVCQALLPEYIVDKVDEEEITVEISDFCNRHGVDWIRDKAVRVESDRVITEKDEVEFDYLVISTGARPFVFENTYSLGDLESAKVCKRALDKAEEVAIIGSGATGIECACELREKGYEIKLIEYLERILPSFTSKVSNYVRRLMEKEGIEIFTSCKVIGVNEAVKTNRGKIECDLAISCAGLKPNPLDGLKTDRGWIVVDEYLRVRKNVFAIGDCALVKVNGKIATKTALEAEMQARITAKNIRRIRKGEKPLKYKVVSSIDKPIAFITLAKNRAVMVYKGIFIPRPMKILYRIKKRIVESFMKRYKM